MKVIAVILGMHVIPDITPVSYLLNTSYEEKLNASRH
jgi:hypothetical protein